MPRPTGEAPLGPPAHSLLAIVAVATLLSGSRAAAQPTPAVAELVELRYKLREQQARLDVAKWEGGVVGVAGVPTPTPPPKLQELVGQILSTTDARPAADAVAPKLVEAWREAEARRIEFQAVVTARERDYGFSLADRTPPPFRLKPLDVAVLGWAGVAFLIGCGLAAHERRVSLRRKARARVPGGIAAVLALGVLGVGGCRGLDGTPPPPPESSAQGVRDATAQAAAETASITTQRDGLQKQLITEWAKFVGADKARQDALVEADASLLKAVRQAAVTAALEERLTGDIQAAANLDKEQETLNAMTSAAVGWTTSYAGARVGAVVLLGLVVAAPYRIARRRSAAERRASAATCPRCLEVGQMAVHRTPSGDKKGEYKESTYVECKTCKGRIARSHQKVPRLCFPTIGIRSSGKTHMLTTAYATVKDRKAPTPAAVQTAPSVMDERFREYIKLILRQRETAGATVHGAEDKYLEPLLIHARDTDRWGQNGVLVNLFDYSGELVEKTPIAEMLGPRAMLMDGIMMFFDPTQIYGEGGVSLQDQVQALDDFYNRMAEERGLPPGTLIPNPVAVCITKFDLLESENPIGGQCLPFIHQLTGPLKPDDGEPVSLATLKARSDLVEQMLPVMFPGVDLRRLVRDYFGTQMLFFPMSSVNLNTDEFGRVDSSERNPAPYGVAEPILWLMHMHGYNVLNEK